MTRDTITTAQDVLTADFQTLIRDSEKLLEHTATLAGEQAEELREQIKASLVKARAALKQTEVELREQGAAALVAAEDYVQTNPLPAIGIAAGVGFLVGLLATRR